MDQQKEVLFTVGGMHCAARSSRLERVLNGMDGAVSHRQPCRQQRHRRA
ncbi:MAG: hypothetical protein ACLR7Z_00590 [Bilophila wadsworthia]